MNQLYHSNQIFLGCLFQLKSIPVFQFKSIPFFEKKEWFYVDLYG